MTFMLCASFKVEMVPVLTRNWSTPTRPQMLPAGTSSMASTRPPIMRIVLWMDFSYRSVFCPGTKLGPMILAFCPVATLPEKNTPECVEPALVGGGHHLGHVHHQRSIRVTVFDAHAGCVVVRSLIEKLSPVLLGGDRRGKVDDNHLEHRVTSWEPVP